MFFFEIFKSIHIKMQFFYKKFINKIKPTAKAVGFSGKFLQ